MEKGLKAIGGGIAAAGSICAAAYLAVHGHHDAAVVCAILAWGLAL